LVFLLVFCFLIERFWCLVYTDRRGVRARLRSWATGSCQEETEERRYASASLFRLRLRNVPRTSVPETWTYRVWFIGKGKLRSRGVDGRWDPGAGAGCIWRISRMDVYTSGARGTAYVQGRYRRTVQKEMAHVVQQMW
jgi:hypothetical protein